MPVEMSLFCSRKAITQFIQFGFKISLALLRGDCYLSSACRYMRGSMHTHTCQHLMIVILKEPWMIDGFAMYSRPNGNTEFFHPVPPISCCLLCQENEKLWYLCVVLIFSTSEHQTMGGMSLGSLRLTLTTCGATQSKGYTPYTFPSAPGWFWFEPAWSLTPSVGVLPLRGWKMNGSKADLRNRYRTAALWNWY